MSPEAALRQHAKAEAAPPSGLSPALLGLWWDAHGDWERAHQAAQDGKDAGSDLVHAYLHRKEGDLANADYWYRRAGCTRPGTALDAEWAAIAAALLAQDAAPRG